VYGSVLQKRLRSEDSRQPTSSQIPDVRLNTAIAAPPKLRSLGLHPELLCDPPGGRASTFIYLFRLLVLAYILLLTNVNFNAIHILVECVHIHRVIGPLDIRYLSWLLSLLRFREFCETLI